MAWTQQSKNGTSYRGLYRDRNGKTRSAGTFPSKSVALDAARELEPKTVPTYREWWETWEPIWPASAGTKRIESGRVNKHTLPQWGDVPLDRITHAKVQAWMSKLSAELSSSSTRTILSVMSTAMQGAITHGYIDANPCRNIRLAKLPPAPDRYLTHEECDYIRGELPEERHRLLFDILLWTGMRFGEAVALHGTEVRDEVVEVKWAYNRPTRMFKTPKSGKPRSVPIPEKLVIPAAGRNEFPADMYQGGNRPHLGLVTGVLVGHERWRQVWVKATAEIGGARTHDLRHTYASRLVAAGVDMREVQRILGHSSIVQTEHYSQFAPSSFAAARDALNKM